MTAKPFELLGPLPTGTTNISASAGTGKTFALAALATRYVAEADVGIGEILIVTFTRSAAAELKDRVRTRLVEAEAALRLGSSEPDDELLAHLWSTDRPVRHRRLEAAVSEFDAATITTIHGFAQQALGTLGVSASADPDASLVEDSEELILAVCADALARRSLTHPVSMSLDALNKMASKVLSLPDVVIIPDTDPHDSEATEWVDIVEEVLGRVTDARRGAGVLAYDDILTHLRDAVVNGGQIATAMSDRFPVALIDEFQDTDPVQWQIFSKLFNNSTLVLVGDPKQAIYAFRGADVHTYLEATTAADVETSSLHENWRSDGVLLQALNAVLRDAHFGEGQIGYVPVEAAEVHANTRILDRAGKPLPPLVFRNGPEPKNGKRGFQARVSQNAVAKDLAQRVRDLIEDATLPDGDKRRPVGPGDIAVLVKSHSETPAIQMALAAHGIPAVMSKVGSVFGSPAAAQLRRLLSGVARPATSRLVRAVAIGWFGSVDAEGLDAFGDAGEVELAEQLHAWAEVLANEGVDEFAATVWAQSDVATRVLQMPDGDRHLTDLEHLIEVLSTTASDGGSLSINGLLEKFDVLAAGDIDTSAEILERRIPSDATAVQIMTVHGSKGLEWPIVCCPSLGRPISPLRTPNVVYHDAAKGRRVIDVAFTTKWDDFGARADAAKGELRAESMRLAYVALTRAQHHVIVWRYPLSNKTATSLSQLLFGPNTPAPTVDEFEALMVQRIASVGDLVEISRVDGVAKPVSDRWTPPEPGEAAELSVATLGRDLNRTARRWSFTAISSVAFQHQTGLALLDPEDTTGGDSGASDEYPGDDAPVEVFVPPVTDLVWGEVPGSATFGTMVHSVFEAIDFQSRPLVSEVARVVGELAAWNEWPAEQATIVEGITQSLATPLGPIFDGISLDGIPKSDRLDEMIFDFTLGNSGAINARFIGDLVCMHLASDDPLLPWANDVASGVFDVDLEGHLTGAIDLIVRLHNPERYVLVDYKTNSLSQPGMPLMSSDYRPDQLAEAMAHHHYPLQALLYGVALHRYLRWRLTGYDPSQHLGGAAYLFVRGMQGPTTPAPDGHPHGVFSWPIPPALVVQLSDLLDGVNQ